MAPSQNNWPSLEARLENLGLSAFGGFEILKEECPVKHAELAGNPALLIGNAGPAMWEIYSGSPEFFNQSSNPMDQWTYRVLSELACEYDACAIFPFEKPYWPFQKFARRAGHTHTSPLGMLIHSQYGLWHAFRGVLVWDQDHEFASHINTVVSSPQNVIHPCDQCADRPCLSACPVKAFDGVTLDRDVCYGHLRSDNKPDCMTEGCRARDACPVGTEHRYCDEQIEFHMKAYALGKI